MKKNQNLEQTMERLKRHPKFMERVNGLLDIMENSYGDCIKANDAEYRVIKEVQQIGNDALTSWASRRAKKVAEIEIANEDVIKHGKKKSTGIQDMEK